MQVSTAKTGYFYLQTAQMENCKNACAAISIITQDMIYTGTHNTGLLSKSTSIITTGCDMLLQPKYTGKCRNKVLCSAYEQQTADTAYNWIAAYQKVNKSDSKVQHCKETD